MENKDISNDLQLDDYGIGDKQYDLDTLLPQDPDCEKHLPIIFYLDVQLNEHSNTRDHFVQGGDEKKMKNKMINRLVSKNKKQNMMNRMTSKIYWNTTKNCCIVKKRHMTITKIEF